MSRRVCIWSYPDNVEVTGECTENIAPGKYLPCRRSTLTERFADEVEADAVGVIGGEDDNVLWKKTHYT